MPQGPEKGEARVLACSQEAPERKQEIAWVLKGGHYSTK